MVQPAATPLKSCWEKMNSSGEGQVRILSQPPKKVSAHASHIHATAKRPPKSHACYTAGNVLPQ